MTTSKVFVFLFRRDLRVEDNVAFSACVTKAREQGARVLPLFIYNDQQIDADKNAYFSDNAVQFMVESLRDLDEQQLRPLGAMLYRLHVSGGNDASSYASKELQVIRHAVSSSFSDNASNTNKNKNKNKNKKNAGEPPPQLELELHFNEDLTPFARERDSAIKDVARAERGVTVHTSREDYTLFPLDDPCVKTQDGTAYKVFHFLYKKRRSLHDRIRDRVGIDIDIAPGVIWFSLGEEGKQEVDEDGFFRGNDDLAVRGGRQRACEILDGIRRKCWKDYDKLRDVLSCERGTTRLSAYLKFGCVSSREVYRAIHATHGIDHPLIRELYFREFYFHVAFFHPRVLEGMTMSSDTGSGKKNRNFDEDVDVTWRTEDDENDDALGRWQRGETGTPLVDAAMRQLNTTGFMHNRGRMVTSMYLTKDLFMDWRLGERYFATRLVDYDPCQNNAGWQWSASTGTDAQPYFRVMNPYTQQSRFDKEAEYVKRWIPELRSVDPRDLVKWEDSRIRDKYPDVEYPAPIVPDHTAAAKHAADAFRDDDG